MKKPLTDLSSLKLFHDEYLSELHNLFSDILNTKLHSINGLRANEDKTVKEQSVQNKKEANALKQLSVEYVDIQKKTNQIEFQIAIYGLKIKQITFKRENILNAINDIVNKLVTFNKVAKRISLDYANSTYFKMNEGNLEKLKSLIDTKEYTTLSDLDIENLISDTKNEFLKIKTDIERRNLESSDKIKQIQLENDERVVTKFTIEPNNTPKHTASRSKELIERIKILKEEKAEKEIIYNLAKKSSKAFEEDYIKEIQEIKFHQEKGKKQFNMFIISVIVILIVLIIIYIIK
jgi:hypothetical protein